MVSSAGKGLPAAGAGRHSLLLGTAGEPLGWGQVTCSHRSVSAWSVSLFWCRSPNEPKLSCSSMVWVGFSLYPPKASLFISGEFYFRLVLRLP